ncbi:MAG TPA: transcription antitermination factor NusB [Bacillota bacterium]|nr:transcription antitermination factor NusB [Bacillota bacterium]
MSRRQARELAFQALFQIDLGRNTPDFALRYACNESDLTDKSREFLEDMVNGTARHAKEIDDLLTRFSEGWPLERMSGTDRNILRMALYELIYREDIPVSVTVNEAVELAKHFGDEESGKFVNGILGNIIRQFTLPEKPVVDDADPEEVHP